MTYQPGTHLIATLVTSEIWKLEACDNFRLLVDSLIDQYELIKLGEVYHDFSPAGYTGVVCLSESHLSVHTWPEHGRVNIDIYLSNYLRINDGTVNSIYAALKEHFSATVDHEQLIRR